MKTKLRQSNSRRSSPQEEPVRLVDLRQISQRRRRAPRHDPMLVLNMLTFNFTDGWSRVFSRDLYGRFSA
jgi:hypothetical protein